MATPFPSAASDRAAAEPTARGQQRYGVLVPIDPIGVQPQHLVDLDRADVGAVQHARAVAAARLPLTDQACAHMVRLAWGSLTRAEHARQQRVAALQQALTACQARIEQQALLADPTGLADDSPPSALQSPDPKAHGAGLAASADSPDTSALCSPRALRHEQLQASLRHPVLAELWAERLGLAGAALLALLFTGMEVSVVSQLNPLLVPMADPTVERTWLVVLSQVLAALMLVTLLGAVRLLATQAGRADLVPSQRVATGAGAALTAASAGLLAAVVTWPAYGPLVEGLLSGQSVASGMGLEADNVPAPLWVRLLTAPALLAIGVMAGHMAQRAVHAAGRLRELKPRLAELDADLAHFQRARGLQTALAQACSAQLAPAQLLQEVEQACTDGYEAYLAGLQRHRQPAVPPHRESTADRLLRQRSDQVLDALVQAAAQAFAQFDPAHPAAHASPLIRNTGVTGAAAASATGSGPAPAPALTPATAPRVGRMSGASLPPRPF